LTGIAGAIANSISKIVNGNSYANIATSDGNVVIGVATTANTANSNIIATFTENGVNFTGIVSSSGNVISASNVTGANFRTVGVVTATGNVTGGNVLTAGLISANGNIISNTYFIGNGSQLTGIAGAIANSLSKIVNGQTYANIDTGNANLVIAVASTANTANSNIIATFYDTGVNFAGMVSSSGNVIGSNIRTGGVVTATGNVTGGNVLTAGNVSATGNIISSNVLIGGSVSTTGNVTANYFIGNGSQLTGIAEAITVTKLVNGNSYANLISADGNLVVAIGASSNTVATFYDTGVNFAGIVSSSGNVIGSNIRTGGVVTATGNITGGNITTAGLITATANVIGGNVLTGGYISAAGNIIANSSSFFIGNGSQLTGVAATTATALTNGNTNITTILNSNATVTIGGTANVAVFATTGEYITGIMSASGNVTGSNILTAGLISAAGNITGGNLIQGTTRVYKWTTQANTAPANPVAGDNWYDSYTDKLYLYVNDGTNSQWVDQSYPSTFGTLAVTGAATVGGTLGVTGNITGGNLSVTTGNITVGNIVNGGSNVAGNIGNSTVYFNTAFIKATNAYYADLAENYVADALYNPGTVLVFGGDHEVTVSDVSHDSRTAGVVSTHPSYLMNAAQLGQYVVSVALTGRVPCWVQGPVAKGDRLVNIRSGIAGRLDPEKFDAGCIIGKSLESIADNSTALIQIAVGRD
jgi:hypothetical protein